MNKNESPQGLKVYTNHRSNQVERILDAAETLFNEHGIENVAMDTIAKQARISRPTLYEYFPNKEEVAFEILKRFIDRRYEQSEMTKIEGETGFERLESFLKGIAEMFEKNPVDARFIAEYNVLYARKGDTERVGQLYAEGVDYLSLILKQGMEDGSICTNYPVDFLVGAIYNFISAMNLRFSLVGDLITKEFNQPAKDLHQAILHIFLQGIQNPAAAKSEQRDH